MTVVWLMIAFLSLNSTSAKMPILGMVMADHFGKDVPIDPRCLISAGLRVCGTAATAYSFLSFKPSSSTFPLQKNRFPP